MNKKIIRNVTISFLILSVLISGFTFAKNTSSKNGRLSLSVAKPISRAVIDGDIHISNYYQKPLNFYVCNYDENKNVSEVAMQYYITITLSQEESPLLYKLYRIYEDREEEVELDTNENTIITVEPVRINNDKAVEHNYILKILYDCNSQNNLDENIVIMLSINSEQINPSV